MSEEYIKREDALVALYDLPYDIESYYTGYTNDAVVDMLEAIPAADVAPVVHGRWIRDALCIWCSNCGDEHEWGEYRASYCECCGAKMDLEVETDAAD